MEDYNIHELKHLTFINQTCISIGQAQISIIQALNNSTEYKTSALFGYIKTRSYSFS